MKLNELTLSEAITGLRSKQFSSVELVAACFDAIEANDPQVKAFLALNKVAAIEEAKLADTLIAKDDESVFLTKPLLGIPYACKDNFNTKGIETTASSAVLKNYIPPYESTVTQKLKDAGAILLGKTNMDAFAHGSSTETSDFFTTLNPWDLSRVAGGSSGGSAAAVALNMCIFAIGSETSGSVRGPAAWCGVSGLKPTYGRVSRYGLIAMASSTDQPGVLAKNIEDCAIILELIAGQDPLDATTSAQQTEKYTDLHGADLKGMRIGFPKSYFEIELEPGVKKLTQQAIEEFKKLGAEIIEIELLDPKYSIAVYTILQRSEVSSNLGRLDGIRYGQPRTEFGFEAKKRMMLGAYVLSAGYYDQYYAKAQRVRTLIVNDFENAFSSVDMIIGPTMPSVALGLGESAGNPLFGELMDVLTNPSSIAGICAVSIPCGFSNKMPVGVQLMGNKFAESKIINAAHLYQKVTNFHKEKPQI